MRDYQKTRVYKWEDKVVLPRDTTPIDENAARVALDYIWKSEGLLYPPALKQIAAQTKRKAGQATRHLIELKFPTKTWILVHELSHSLNDTIDNPGDEHGPNYLGIYMRMLAKYVNIPLPLLMYTAKEAGLDFNLAAQFAVLDH